MNNALNIYEDEKNMWCINGYTYRQLNNKTGASISKYVSPWGWATWSDRWNIFVNQDYIKRISYLIYLFLKEKSLIWKICMTGKI